MDMPPALTPAGLLNVHNGDPARALDAHEIDRSTAAVVLRRATIPAHVGAPLVLGPTYSRRVLVPCYTLSVGSMLLVSGRGTVRLRSSDDAYYVERVISGDDLGASELEEAQHEWLIDELAGASTDGLDRALQVTEQSSPHAVTFTLEVTASDVNYPLRVWSWLLVPLQRRSEKKLPA